MKMRGLFAGPCAVLAALAVMVSSSAAFAQARPKPIEADYSFWTPAYSLAQQRLLTKTIEGLQPQRPGVRDVYILAAGLYGQHVFENEAAQGAAALSAHFRSEGRAIVLSNDHHEGPVEYAAAAPDHIQTALAAIAEKMDKDEDVAVIFLTSHGSMGLGIAGFEPVLSGGDTPMRDFMITPGVLRGALDASGIKNRIIILSACFSGQFIPTLQDTHTVVIAAASPDRTSFGCRAENDWTYFGDAFFNQALPQSKSLLGAFDAAKVLITNAETQGSLTPSLPQSFVGTQTKYLAEIEKK
jgi:hypothetical protein